MEHLLIVVLICAYILCLNLFHVIFVKMFIKQRREMEDLINKLLGKLNKSENRSVPHNIDKWFKMKKFLQKIIDFTY